MVQDKHACLMLCFMRVAIQNDEHFMTRLQVQLILVEIKRYTLITLASAVSKTFQSVAWATAATCACGCSLACLCNLIA